MSTSRFALTITAILCAASVAAPRVARAALPPLIARDVIFGNPERVAPQLSPDGKRLAYIAPRGGVLNVWVRTIGKSDDRPVTNERARPVGQFFWAENATQLIYAQDKGGDENYHLFRVDLKTNAEKDLTPYPKIRAGVIGVEPAFPNTILVQMNNRDPRLMDAHRVNLQTGKLTLAAQNPGAIVGWVADAKLQVRAAVAVRPDGGTETLVRATEKSPWRTLISFPFGEQGGPAGFTADGKALYIESDKDVNTQRLYRMDIATGKMELLHAREDVDLSSLIMHPTRHTVQAVGYNRARQEWVALDPAVKADFAALRKAMRGDFSIVGRDNADTTWLVSERRDDGPIIYYTYKRATRTATRLFSARPKLEGLKLARMQPVDIKSRDGLVLPSYLSLPVGVPAKNLPLVLNVHGGPWARDTWGYNGEVQWLCNRGYGVLQVNFRGSTGFGKKFLNAANREWAGKMHDDLVDAVRWAINKGYADPRRVAIYGGSYGGYATLVGLTFTPDLFACGIDVVGPSSILTLLASIPPYWAPVKSQFIQRVGDPEKDKAFLESRSPLFKADRIKKPLLIAQGANDPRVKQAEAEQIVRAMRKNNQPVTYLLFPDEGHGFARPENRLKFYAAAEKFLAVHLGGRFEPAKPGEEPPIVPPGQEGRAALSPAN